MVKNLPAVQETWIQSLGQEDPWRRKWQPTPVFLPGKCHGQRSLAGYSPWGCKESDMTYQLSIHTYIRENSAETSRRGYNSGNCRNPGRSKFWKR